MGYIGIYSLTILFHQMEVENKMETGLCRGRQCKGKGNSCNQARARIARTIGISHVAAQPPDQIREYSQPA